MHEIIKDAQDAQRFLRQALDRISSQWDDISKRKNRPVLLVASDLLEQAGHKLADAIDLLGKERNK